MRGDYDHPDDYYDPADDDVPCCDYRDHGSGACACPDHERSALHPFGHEYVHDPDDLHRPGSDAHTNARREGY